jgi:hypothetical protein
MNARDLNTGHDAAMPGSSLVALFFILATAHAASASPAYWRSLGWKTDFSQASVPFSEIMSGGPPRDGIPPIDRPQFKPANEIKDIGAREPVIVFPLDTNAQAYPLRVLMWHEIVNDTVAGKPVAITYCPLCNAALVFDRRVAGRILDFGTTGLLRNSDLVMWDRQTESWWQQFSGDAIVGSYTGTALKLLPSRVLPFGEYLARWPNGQVLVPANPNLRQYGRNPYSNYDESLAPALFRGELPKGLPAMARVVVARTGKGQVAVSLALLSRRGKIEHAGIEFSWRAGQATALGDAEIAKGKDVGTVEVTAKDGSALVHDITFAFVLNAFVKDAVVLTDKGLIRLATGEAAGG